MLKPSFRSWQIFLAVLVLTPWVHAAVTREETGRFDGKVIHEPTAFLGQVGETPDEIQGFSAGRAGWEEFRAKSGGGWDVRIDRRSGTPLLVSGSGIRWFDADGATAGAAALEAHARAFVKANELLLNVREAELVFDEAASAPPAGGDRATLVFRRQVAGIPVEGERFLLSVVRGNLVSFGADRWGAIDRVPDPVYGVGTARELLFSHMGIHRGDDVEEIESGTLVLTPAPPAEETGPWTGSVGAGITHRLARRFVVRVAGEIGTWVGKVDAVTGQVLALYDDDRYAQVRGWVYPKSSDQNCGAYGCLLPGYPMPFASLTVNGGAETSNDAGMFDCSGGTAATALQGPYVRISDACGAVNEIVTCDAHLDLSGIAGTNCTVPAGRSAGDTNAARSGFWIINRIMEKARYWLPANTWLQNQVQVNTNVNSTCNASWNGQLNMYRAGSGCRNTAETAGVLNHEFGHGLDQNDGGGYDNTSEGYADVIAILSDRSSCVGRGFFETQFCSGYGDACLSCTGIRDHDFAARTANTPATPANFTSPRCGSGSGPCGKAVHCEAYVPAGALYDLAVRDLPASGMDAISAWQLTERLFYKSRQGSGGNAFNCTLPNSDGCNAGGWFNTMRVADDDDGNLANGTPHAAAIFAAFNRHAIACGLVGAASNQNSSSCPSLVAPSVSASNGSNAVVLSWAAVPNATTYMVMRSDVACSETMNILADVAAPATSYTDTDLPNGFTFSYRIQARTSNTACESPVSACVQGTPQPFAGTVKLDRSVYACGQTLQITVTDANIGGSTTTVAVSSGTESTPETVVLTETAPGSANYTGSLVTTTGAAVNGDALLSVVNGDTITAIYIDADDGQGNTNVSRSATAVVDCLPPVITDVQSSMVTGNSARITWTTNEPADRRVRYGTSIPPGSTTSAASLATAHTLDLTGLPECSLHYYSVESADVVSNLATDNAGGAYYTFATGKNVSPSFNSTDTPIAIPDNNTTGATSTINVTDTQTVLEVKVRVNITHTFTGDIALSLIAPNGTTVALSTRRGSSGDNYTNTLFDDAAATGIAAGTAPFTGSFRPETPLAAATGIPATGAWRLKVVDSASVDVGTIDNWTLFLRYPAAACGPHAKFNAKALVADVCSAGGPGSGNGTWDAGETVDMSVTLENDGTVLLTGVTATLVPTTPGVTMVNATATYPSIPVAGTATSDSPHFRVALPASLACGGTVGFDLQVNSTQGSWTSSLTPQGIGQVIPGGGTALDEGFTTGIPATWAIVDGGTGGGAAATWTAANPGSRTAAAPMANPLAIVDSDNAGTAATQNEELISPVIDLSAATGATLEFDQYFRWYSSGQAEKGDVDVRSSLTGGAWVNVFRNQGASTANPDHKTLNITAQAAGAADVQIRFRYYDAAYEWYWQIDNVKVTYAAPGGCSMNSCAAGPAAPPRVPDGTFGQPMSASRVDPAATSIDLTWDVSACTASDYHLLFGPLSTVASYAVSGSRCDLGTGGAYSWVGAPSGDLWYVVVSDDNANVEGSWGRNSSGGERSGTSSSGQCLVTSRNNTGTCP